MTAPRLVIFDFDGVLGDTEDVYHAALAAAVRTAGIELPREEYYRLCIGLPDLGALAAVFAAHGLPLEPAHAEQLIELRRRAYTSLLHRAHLFAGVPEMLRLLRRERLLAIASGAFRDEIDALLARDAVRDLFSAVVAAEDVERGKPAPDPFLRALEEVNRAARLRLTPADCIVVEDSPHGIEAAHAAGMRCIGVATSQERSVLAAADRVIGHIRELAETEELRA
jgi:beta-phosphoglucomutase